MKHMLVLVPIAALALITSTPAHAIGPPPCGAPGQEQCAPGTFPPEPSEQPGGGIDACTPGIEQPGCIFVPVIQEDDPAWDCTTMGNQICGIPMLPFSFDLNTAQWPRTAAVADRELPETGRNVTLQLALATMIAVAGMSMVHVARRVA